VIERAPQPVRVLDVPRVRELVIGALEIAAYREPWELRAWESIVEGYFSLQNNVLFDEFWAEFTSVQTPLVVMGAPFFGPRPLKAVAIACLQLSTPESRSREITC
jgi:hypothetical protein